jgi:hypothetical protein
VAVDVISIYNFSPSHPRSNPLTAVGYATEITNLALLRGVYPLALPDLGPVLPPLGSAACRLAVLGRHVRSSRHLLIERKAKSSAGGLHVLLIIMWPDTALAILLLQLLLN